MAAVQPPVSVVPAAAVVLAAAVVIVVVFSVVIVKFISDFVCDVSGGAVPCAAGVGSVDDSVLVVTVPFDDVDDV